MKWERIGRTNTTWTSDDRRYRIMRLTYGGYSLSGPSGHVETYATLDAAQRGAEAHAEKEEEQERVWLHMTAGDGRQIQRNDEAYPDINEEDACLAHWRECGCDWEKSCPICGSLSCDHVHGGDERDRANLRRAGFKLPKEQ